MGGNNSGPSGGSVGGNNSEVSGGSVDGSSSSNWNEFNNHGTNNGGISIINSGKPSKEIHLILYRILSVFQSLYNCLLYLSDGLF